MFQQNVSADNKNRGLIVICTLRVNTCEVSVYTARTLMNAHKFALPKKLYQIINKT